MAIIRNEPYRDYDDYAYKRVQGVYQVLNIINPTVSQANYSCYCSIMVDLTMGMPLEMIEHHCRKRRFIVSLEQLRGLGIAANEQIRLDISP